MKSLYPSYRERPAPCLTATGLPQQGNIYTGQHTAGTSSRKKQNKWYFCTLNAGSFLSTVLQSQSQDRLTFFPAPALTADQAVTASPHETGQRLNTLIFLILTVRKYEGQISKYPTCVHLGF